MPITAITGHRPENLGTQHEKLWFMLGKAMVMLETTMIYQGMAAGADLASAKVAWRNGILYVCVKPWKGHAPRVCDRDEYRKVLSHAHKVVDVSDSVSYPGPWCYQARNEYMIDRAEQVLAVWNGYKGGGTWNAIDYALDTGKPVFAINPDTLEAKWVAE